VLHAGEPPGLAVIASWRPWQRSVLYVYEPSGGLVYQEVFEGTYQAIAAQRLVDENADTLLLGGEGQVWAYRP
jgi:hypothetical protein